MTASKTRRTGRRCLPRLFDYSPAWVLHDDAAIGFDLSFTQGMRLTGFDPMAVPDETLEGFSAQLAAALSCVPGGAVLRFVSAELSDCSAMLRAYSEPFDGQPNGAETLGGYVARKKVAQCTQQLRARQRELFGFVSVAALEKFNGYAPQALGRSLWRIRKRAAALHEQQLAAVERVRTALGRELAALGVSVQTLPGDALFEVMWRLANPALAARMPPPDYRADTSLRCQLFASGAVSDVGSFRRASASSVERVVTLRSPPQHVQPLQAFELTGLPFAHLLVVTLKRVSDDEAQRRVEKTRLQGHEWNRVLAKVRGSERNAELPDHHVRRQHAHADDVLARLAAGESLFDVAIHLWFAAASESDLDHRTDQVLSRIRSCGRAEGAVEQLHPCVAFLGMLPGHHSLVGDRHHPMLASRAADLLPVFQAWSGASRPTTILATRRNELVGFEPFSKELQAWNATVAGGTGSGKSFTTRTLLTGWIAGGGRVIVVTRGADYRRFVEVFGGSVSQVALDDRELCLGPFPAPIEVATQAGGEAALEHLASIVAMMVAEPGERSSRLKRRLIFSATRRLYGGSGTEPSPGGTPTFAHWIDALRACVDETPQEGQELHALAAQIIAQLRFWLDGPYGAALMRPRPPQRDVQVSAWDLGAISDSDTQGVVLALLSGSIATSIQTGPTIVVMDEVWSLLRSAAGADLIETLYRTVRKSGSAIWTISQSINDYTGLAESCRSAVLNNSPIKVLLAHDASELDVVSATFKLNEREAQLLASLRSIPGQYSEMLMFFGVRRQVLRLQPTGIEYWLATSHPKDHQFEAMARAAQPGVPHLELLKRLARRYPHGALDVDLRAA